MYQPSGTSSNINIRVRTYARELQANIHTDTRTHAYTDFYTLTFHTRLHRAQLTGSAPSKGHARHGVHPHTQQQIERQRNLCPLVLI